MDGGCIVARSISRHFEMEPRQDSILFYLFFFFFLFFFPLHGPFLIIVITIGRPFAHALFSPSFIPLRASLPMPPLPSTYPPSSLAIEFGRANYIFSPLVEGIKL